MVQGLLGRKDRNNGNGNGFHPEHNSHQTNYVDYLAEARHHLNDDEAA